MNSKAKGAAFERWVTNYFKEWGLESKRGFQRVTNHGNPDIYVPGLFSIEAKIGSKWTAYRAMAQAVTNRIEGSWPLVVARHDRALPLAIMLLDDFMKLLEIKGVLTAYVELEKNEEAARDGVADNSEG